MAKLKLNPGRGPISKKVISSAQKALKRKIIDISELRKAKIRAEDLEKTIISEEGLSEYDPLHAVYIYGQNKISVFIEQIAELPGISKLTNAYVHAEDLYMPSGPPMSPLTKSYFTCWAYFDLCAGIKKESLGTVAIDVCKFFNVDEGLIRVFENMQNSRMGFYVHEGISGNCVSLRELITDKKIQAIVPSGYLGNTGEIWCARIMPEPLEGFGYSVVFITPYVIGEVKGDKFYPISNEGDWLTFFDRNLDKTGIKEKILAYESFMKYGLERNYWNEYIFEAYVNHRHDMIWLTGFPDIPLSKPHSKESQERMGL